MIIDHFEKYKAKDHTDRNQNRRLKMIRYKGQESVLEAVLGDYADMGFKLIEDDDHVVEIYFKEKRISRLYQTAKNLTVEVIRRICQQHLDGMNRLVDFG